MAPNGEVAHVTFQFEPEGDVLYYGLPPFRELKARLKVVLWRRDENGILQVGEEHPLAEAHSLREFDILVLRAKEDLDRARSSGHGWFGSRPPPWR